MKATTRAFVALACSAALLTGCSANPEPDPSGSNSTDTSSPAATPSAAGPTTAEVASPSPAVVDVEEAKTAAIAAGRPEAAWDKNCLAWDLPEAEGDDEQSWTNGLARTWLETHEADCPDAIVFPHYYVESFAQGAR